MPVADSSLIASQPASSPKSTKHNLDIYILDYLQKNSLQETAKALLSESTSLSRNEQENIPTVNVPEGFLHEWWAVFWDIFSTKSVDQLKQLSLRLKELDMVKDRSVESSPSLGRKRSKSEYHMEAILEAQKAQIAAAQALTLKQQEILNATIASQSSTRENSFSGPSPSVSHTTPSSLSMSLNGNDFDSLNLEERRIWLQHLQQNMIPNQRPMMQPMMNWSMQQAQPYAMVPPRAPIIPAANLYAPQGLAHTPPLFYNPQHRYSNVQMVPTTPQYIKPAPNPPTNNPATISDSNCPATPSKFQTSGEATDNSSTYFGTTETPVFSSDSENNYGSNSSKYGLMNESLMNESLFLDLDNIFFATPSP